MARRVKAGRPRRKFESKHSKRKPTGRRLAQQRKRRIQASKKRRREEEDEEDKYVESRKRRERTPKKEGGKRDYDHLTDDVESPDVATYDSSCGTGSVSGRTSRADHNESSSPATSEQHPSGSEDRTASNESSANQSLPRSRGSQDHNRKSRKQRQSRGQSKS